MGEGGSSSAEWPVDLMSEMADVETGSLGVPEADGRSAAGVVLAVCGVSKDYGQALVVKDVHLDVADGEFVTLLGPSGSGKTTILNIVAGFVKPTAGDVVLEGRSMLSVPPHRRNLGMVFQNYALFPHMSAAENVAFPLKMRRLPKPEIRTRVDETLRMVNLGDRGSAKASELSGGQQQRIALARALVYRPRMLLMDEPMAALDKQLRDRLQEEVRSLQQRLGIAVLYVTHDQTEAFLMSDRIAVMNDGQLMQVGSGEELYHRPASMFVANFVGESNTFAGQLLGPDSLFAIAGSTVRVPVSSDQVSTPGNGTNRCMLMVRPERVVMHETPPPGGPQLVGVVSSRRFVGDAVKYTVKVAELGREIVSRQPAGSAMTDVGCTVYVGWRMDHCMIVADE
jgi:putative spermidine/putrescine transport system ATP-binding protein